MSIKLKKIQRVNPQNREESKWYLTQEKTGTIGMEEIAAAVARNSSHALGDVRSILTNIVELAPVFLKLGQTINLEGFGSFHLSVTSEGVDTPEELSARKIKATKLRFLPSMRLKHNLEGLSFEGI
jgi:predicted histone-like DNA-binding protein